MKKVGAIFGIVVLMIIMTTAATYAKGPGSRYGCKGPGCGGLKEHVPGLWNDADTLKELGISPEQAESLKTLDFDFRENAIHEKYQMEKAQLTLEKVLSSKKLNDNDVRKAASVVIQQQGKIMMLKIEHQLAVRKVLSLEQVTRLESMMKKKSVTKRTRHYRHSVKK